MDHDPLYRFLQWQANLRVLEILEIKTVPYIPSSHPFVERLIGTIRRECLDRMLFWTTADLEAKLFDFQHYYNEHRAHAGLGGATPEESSRSHGKAHPLVVDKMMGGTYMTPHERRNIYRMHLTGEKSANRKVIDREVAAFMPTEYQSPKDLFDTDHRELSPSLICLQTSDTELNYRSASWYQLMTGFSFYSSPLLY